MTRRRAVAAVAIAVAVSGLVTFRALTLRAPDAATDPVEVPGEPIDPELADRFHQQLRDALIVAGPVGQHQSTDSAFYEQLTQAEQPVLVARDRLDDLPERSDDPGPAHWAARTAILAVVTVALYRALTRDTRQA